ncbi:MAG: hypothetical protein R3C19_22535 [Planctomycetaceae bacterium]
MHEQFGGEMQQFRSGDYSASLETVTKNIRDWGSIECCEFVPGWFAETLPTFGEPVVLAMLDVDLVRVGLIA